MKFYLLILITVLFWLPSGAAIIKGEIEGGPNQVVKIFQYTDFISLAMIQIGEVRTNNVGEFHVTLELEEDMPIEIRTKNISLQLHVTQEGEYEVLSEAGTLRLVGEERSDLNGQIQEIDSLIRQTEDAYLKAKKTKLVKGVEILDGLRNNYLASSKYVEDIVTSKILQSKVNFLVRLKVPAGSPELTDLDNYFRETGFQANNPYFVKLFDSYIYQRYNFTKWKRSLIRRETIFEQLFDEINYYEGSKIYDLAKVIGIRIAYTGQWFRNKERMLSQVEEVLSTISDRDLLEIGQRLSRMNNTYNEGDRFPDLVIQNEFGILQSIYDIDSKFILIDFWATWCIECIKEMKAFPVLQSIYRDKLKIVSISVDEKLSKVTSFKNRNNYNWVFMLDVKGKVLADELSIKMYPTYLILNKDKEIVRMSDYDFDVKKELKLLIK